MTTKILVRVVSRADLDAEHENHIFLTYFNSIDKLFDFFQNVRQMGCRAEQ